MYDLTYIVNPNLSGEEVAGLKKGIKDLVIGKDGRIETEIPETKKRLAYPINKLTNGYYISFDFEIDPENLPEIDKKLRLENNILRYLIVKKIEKKVEVEAVGGEVVAAKKPREKRAKKEERVKIDELDKKLEELLQ